jgi:hypothetical protein
MHAWPAGRPAGDDSYSVVTYGGLLRAVIHKNRRCNYVDMMCVPRIYHVMHISYVHDDAFRISSSISLVIKGPQNF